MVTSEQRRRGLAHEKYLRQQQRRLQARRAARFRNAGALLGLSFSLGMALTEGLRPYAPLGVVPQLLLYIFKYATGPRAQQWWMDAAVYTAGPRRSHLREDWRAVLAGSPEDGLEVPPRGRRRLLAGFVVAAIRMRVSDIARPIWRPVDWLLATEQRTNTAMAAVVGGQAIYIVGDGGLGALATEIWEPCAILSGALFVLARWLRRLRGIELAPVDRTDTTGEE